MTIKGITYELWIRESECYPLNMSDSFSFLLETALHHYDITKINNLYITKQNFIKWKNNEKPNSWMYFLDFSGGKMKHRWSVVGTIDMNKIKKRWRE